MLNFQDFFGQIRNENLRTFIRQHVTDQVSSFLFTCSSLLAFTFRALNEDMFNVPRFQNSCVFQYFAFLLESLCQSKQCRLAAEWRQLRWFGRNCRSLLWLISFGFSKTLLKKSLHYSGEVYSITECLAVLSKLHLIIYEPPSTSIN